MKRYNWKRKEYVTRGADPTVVVTWKSEDYEITEFQGIYLTQDKRGKAMNGPVAVLAEELHKALEMAHDLRREHDDVGTETYRP